MRNQRLELRVARQLVLSLWFLSVRMHLLVSLIIVYAFVWFWLRVPFQLLWFFASAFLSVVFHELLFQIKLLVLSCNFPLGLLPLYFFLRSSGFFQHQPIFLFSFKVRFLVFYLLPKPVHLAFPLRLAFLPTLLNLSHFTLFVFVGLPHLIFAPGLGLAYFSFKLRASAIQHHELLVDFVCFLVSLTQLTFYNK